MNIYQKLNEEQRELLVEAGNDVENKDYSNEEIQKIESSIASHIFSMSKNEMPNKLKKYSEILNVI